VLDSAMGQMRVKAAFAAIHAIEGHHPILQAKSVPERVPVSMFHNIPSVSFWNKEW